MLAYGSIANSIDEYIKIGKSSPLNYLEYFYKGVISCFGEEYSCCHTIDDLRRLLVKGEES
jgi:hypothetical protein